MRWGIRIRDAISTVVWKAFLTEIDHEIQQYQVYRAYRNTQQAHGREAMQPAPISVDAKLEDAPRVMMGPAHGHLNHVGGQ